MTSKQVKQIREALGLTLEEFGRAMLVSWTTVWRWEHGGAAKMDPLRRLALEQIHAELSSKTGRHSGKVEKCYRAAALDSFPPALIIEALNAARRRQR